MRKLVFFLFLCLTLFSCVPALMLSDIHTENIPNQPNVFPVDSNVVNLVQPYKLELESDMSKVVGISTDEMYKQKPESNLTNYLSDLLLEEGQNYCKTNNYDFVPGIAYVNYGGIRASLPKGEITIGNIFELMPFENEMVIVELKGEKLEKLAERIAGHGGDGVAGMTIGIRDGKLSHLLIDGKKLVQDQSYFLVTNDYVAGGGDGMSMLSDRIRLIPTGLKIRDVIINNMNGQYQKGERIQAKKDGRIYYEQ